METLPTNNKKKVLVVDDDISIRDLLSKLFRDTGGYEVHLSSNGKEAIEVLRTVIPNVIVCDIMMPEMNGLELFNTLKNDELLCNVPFLFLSARDRNEDKLLGFELGADDYIVKPFSPIELLMRVKAILNRYNDSTDATHPFRLNGSLAINSISDILQLPSVANSFRSTLVVEDSHHKPIGAIYLQEGKIVNAVVEGKWGIDSAYKLINTREGFFKYYPNTINVNIEATINKPIISVLLSAAEVYDTQHSN